MTNTEKKSAAAASTKGTMLYQQKAVLLIFFASGVLLFTASAFAVIFDLFLLPDIYLSDPHRAAVCSAPYNISGLRRKAFADMFMLFTKVLSVEFALKHNLLKIKICVKHKNICVAACCDPALSVGDLHHFGRGKGGHPYAFVKRNTHPVG